MTPCNEPTKSFEDRLLTELRRVVAANPEPVPASASAGSAIAHRLPRTLTVAGGLATAALASVAVIGFGDEGENTAWAVTPNGDGTVTVVINHLSDADGLEQKLRDEGVPAVVQYLPEGKKCADPPPGGVAPAEFGWASALGFPQGGVAVSAPWGELEAPPSGGEGYQFTINPVPDGQSLSIATQTRAGAEGGSTFEENALRIEYFAGDESPCDVVDAP
jgi:hypothetical protein